MSPPRTKCRPKLELSIWQKKENLYFADRIAIEAQLRKVNRSDEDIRRRMGFGYSHLENLLAGKGLDIWAAAHVETGIGDEKEKGGNTNFVDWEDVAKRLKHYENGPF